MTKIVLVSTSASDLKGHPTGTWLEEVATPYYRFKEAGYEVVIASPNGGPIPLDQNSLMEGFFTNDSKKFMHDYEAVGMLSHSVKLDTIDFSTGIDAIYLAGGHGVCDDYVGNPTLKAALELMYGNGKVVAADCHGPIALAECKKPDNQVVPLVEGLKVTGFSNSEEDAVQLTDKVPFTIETRFIEQGGLYEKADDWQSKVCVDGNLVTGQNPGSSEECAQAVITLLSA